jgi:hypothetical protein
MSAQKKWRRLDGQNRLSEVISGVEFRDGVRQLQIAAWSRVTNFCAYFNEIATPAEARAILGLKGADRVAI